MSRTRLLTNLNSFLCSLVGRPVIVTVKSGIEYKGFFASFDQRLYLRLNNTEEIIDGECIVKLGGVLIRSDDVSCIREVVEENE